MNVETREVNPLALIATAGHPPREPERLRSLDGLRGIAALSVVLYHCILTYFGSADAIPFLTFAWNGHAAVIVFFVLSGLVLSLPYWSGRADGWGAFVTRRGLRIYPIFALSVALVPCGIALVQRLGGQWRPLPTWAEFASELMMVERPVNVALNGVSWTLVHEMRISLIFPLLIVAMKASGNRSIFIAFTSSTIARIIGDWVPESLATFLLTLHFVWLFILGAEIGRNLDWIRTVASQLPILGGYAILAIILIILGFDVWSSFDGLSLTPEIEVASGGLVTFSIVFNPLRSLLETALPQFLGRISYPIYLTHGFMIDAALHMAPPHVPVILTLLVAVTCSALMAELLVRLVERPMIRLGREITSSWSKPSAARGR